MRITPRRHHTIDFTKEQKVRKDTSRRGFTIVEPLIVVAVVALLVAITLATYNTPFSTPEEDLPSVLLPPKTVKPSTSPRAAASRAVHIQATPSLVVEAGVKS